MCTLVLLMVIAGAAVEYTTSINRQVQRSSTLENAVTVGDSCIEILYANWRNIGRNNAFTSNPVPSSKDLQAIPTPAPGQFPNLSGSLVTSPFVKQGGRNNSGNQFDPKQDGSIDYNRNFTISNYKVIAVSPEETALPNSAAPTSSASPTPALAQDGTSKTFNYIASADVTFKNRLGGDVVAKVRRVFQRQELSPWNYAIFYVDPLEIHPGPQFVVNGWVHTNGDLFTGHSNLTFTDKVTYVDNWKVGFKDDPSDPNGRWENSHAADTPASPNYPGSPNYNSALPNYGQTMTPARDVDHQPFGIDPAASFDIADANQDNDSYHELVEKRLGTVANDPLAGERFYDQADFKIVVDASNNVTVTERTGATTEKIINGSSPGQDKKNYTEIMAAITTGGQIQDNREGSTMKVTTIDVGSLVTSLATSKLQNWNKKVIYISATSPSGTEPAVKIVNGAVLPPGGLTIASNNPVYIQGDYNTGGTGTNVPSNVAGSYSDPSNPPDPEVAGYDRASRPALVIGDAVSVLSSAWLDTNSFAGLSSRVANPTTVNTAIVSGIVQSSNGNYSGGAENFPRFVENWSGKTFTYYGSMVELYASQTANGNWAYGGNIYQAPVREWFFDTNFRLNPPNAAGGLMFVNYIKGRWYLL